MKVDDDNDSLIAISKNIFKKEYQSVSTSVGRVLKKLMKYDIAAFFNIFSSDLKKIQLQLFGQIYDIMTSSIMNLRGAIKIDFQKNLGFWPNQGTPPSP